MSSSLAPGDAPPRTPSRLQFNLRTMLALTALVAWMFGWLGIVGIAGIIVLASMAFIEAGCTRDANVVSVLTRNLLAFFVCSLVFGAVGFGLMFGRNPTGWFGTDQFVFAPLRTLVEPIPPGGIDPSDPDYHAQMRVQELRGLLLAHTVLCTMASVVAHRVLARRVRFGAYLIVWIGMAGLVYPLVGSWMWIGASFDFEYMTWLMGWLSRLGFSVSVAMTLPASAVAGMATLAGTLIFGWRLYPEDERLSLLAPHCHRLLVCLGYGLPWLFFVVAPPIVLVFSWPTGSYAAHDINMAFVPAAAGTGGLLAAMIGTRLWLKRFHWPLALGGGFGSLIALLVGEIVIGVWWAGLLGLVAGALVVLVSFILCSLRVDDPGGAFAVHAACGALGVLSIGLFPEPFAVGGFRFTSAEVNHLMQLFGLAVSFAWVFFASAALFWLIRRTMMLPTRGCRTRREPLP